MPQGDLARQKEIAETARNEAQTNEQKAIAARIEADANARAAAEQRGLALEARRRRSTSIARSPQTCARG